MVSASDILNARILVVDDQKAYVLLLERMLRGAGYVSIASTSDPSAVCELHRNNRYDLILLDLQMPRMDGFQVMESLKAAETDGHVSVLVITAQPDHKLRALKAGAADFVSKPYDLAEVLIRVRSMLENHLLHLETKQLHDRVLAQQKLSQQLLQSLLPETIAQRLGARAEIAADSFTAGGAARYDEVTVLFADIVGFTSFSADLSADALVNALNGIFASFDAIADQRGVERIKTIGDVYMAAAGLPVAAADHAARAAHMALDMLEALDRFNRQNNSELQLCIGVSSGAAVAGVIGARKFHYDLWGEVVNSASRMQSRGVAGRIQLTDSTRRRLGEPFVLEARGSIDGDAMDAAQTWFLNGRK